MKKLIGCTIWVVICLSGCSSFQQIQQSRSGVRLKVKSACDTIIVPPSFVKVDSQEMIKTDRGTFKMIFETNDSCDVGPSLIYTFLNENGWEPTRPGSFYYFRENHVVSVSCSVPVSRKGPNTLSITCAWDEYGDNVRDLY